MAYRANPFLERMSERTTSDQEFVRLFAPNVLDRLPEDVFDGAVHIFRSPPGGGKTTLLRAFTPAALRAFWHTARGVRSNDAFNLMLARGLIHETDGPQVLGVYLSCASGYADLPPGATLGKDGLLRSLLDARVVLRAMRSLATLLGFASFQDLAEVRVHYDQLRSELAIVPRQASALELLHWAEQRERLVYAALDAQSADSIGGGPVDVRFEGLLWLQAVQFEHRGKAVAPRRLLMVDDLHKLRKKQRALVIEEFAELRPTIPIWLAERNIALGEILLSQGVREGRDVHEHSLEQIWATGNRGQHQFVDFAENVLDRRFDVQNFIPAGSFSSYLRNNLLESEVANAMEGATAKLSQEVERLQSKPRYSEWLQRVRTMLAHNSLESLNEIYSTKILLARDEMRNQLTLDLIPLSTTDLEERDSSQVHAAGEIFIHNEWGVPHYFGLERLCILATNNIEELLAIAAALYEVLKAKQALRNPELVLSPAEQERVVKDVAKRRRNFIPKNHTEGTRAQRLLDSIGSYCRERTFLPNAPYAPGVTGVRLSTAELMKLDNNSIRSVSLKRVLSECVAENLLVARQIQATAGRLPGTAFYLNRTLCALHDLPLQMGGWQDVPVETLCEWMERGKIVSQQRLPEAGR